MISLESFENIKSVRDELRAYTNDQPNYTPQGYSERVYRMDEAIDLVMRETGSNDRVLRMYLAQDDFTWDKYIEMIDARAKVRRSEGPRSQHKGSLLESSDPSMSQSQRLQR